MKKTTTKKNDKKASAKTAKPKAKRTSVVELRKEIAALKERNMRLLSEVGNLSAMYMNTLTDKNKSERSFSARQGNVQKEAVVMATKRVVAFLMQTYGFALSDLTR